VLSPLRRALQHSLAWANGSCDRIRQQYPVRYEAPLHDCQNTFARVAVEADYRLNAFQGNIVRRREAGAIDLVILVVEHIGIVGMEPLAIRCLSALARIART
jgi:hypothetical protein